MSLVLLSPPPPPALPPALSRRSSASALLQALSTCATSMGIGSELSIYLDNDTVTHFDDSFIILNCGPWVWHRLPYPPFTRVDVSSYAVQPDGCILVSTRSHATGATATFIFDTKQYVWKPYGDWVLPFTGRGHYDPCTMASTGTGDTSNRLHPSPDWKCSKETVYNKNPAERHVSATLVHMRRGKFCLVECVSIDDVRADQELRETGADQELREPGVVDQLWQELWERQEEIWEPEKEILETEDPGSVPRCGRFMYRVKTFSLRYDANGDLKLKHCRVRCYSLPHEASTDFLLQDPVAFWL
uniref:Uncharacterized protein n=1 Tax=Setaria viridis TaxID=4556 RepID=A0A4U6T898_SETVI|nr:hypothetical protein SEVIR_9G496700v2 [Setaria viridis]